MISKDNEVNVTMVRRIRPRVLILFLILVTTFIFTFNYYLVFPSNTKNKHDYKNPNNFKIPSKPDFPSTNPTSTLYSLSHYLNSNKTCRKTQVRSHPPYTILSNFIHPCEDPEDQDHPLVTLTTHSEHDFLLENLPVLTARWSGPISLAIYATGTDFEAVLLTILKLLRCNESGSLIEKFVSFHLFFDVLPSYNGNLIKNFNCNVGHTLGNFRKTHNILYPINVARNLAKNTASTKFVFPSDIELYPNPTLLQDFSKFVENYGEHNSRNLYVLPIFEVEETTPNNKKELKEMLQSGKAIPFHARVCAHCHGLPGYEVWLQYDSEQLSVFLAAQRKGKHKNWEPIYIGEKHSVIDYDERLSWEGLKDKMTQALTYCLLNYTFHILDSNAFLTHAPGIKTQSPLHTDERKMLFNKQVNFIKTVILPEISILYGDNEECDL